MEYNSSAANPSGLGKPDHEKTSHQRYREYRENI
jgi:hypothetical protein